MPVRTCVCAHVCVHMPVRAWTWSSGPLEGSLLLPGEAQTGRHAGRPRARAHSHTSDSTHTPLFHAFMVPRIRVAVKPAELVHMHAGAAETWAAGLEVRLPLSNQV